MKFFACRCVVTSLRMEEQPGAASIFLCLRQKEATASILESRVRKWPWPVRPTAVTHILQSRFFSFEGGSNHFNDKPMITTDTNLNSPFRDNVYIAWDAAVGGSTGGGIRVC